MAKRNIPRLAVVFDTNVLFTKVASDLVRNDVKRLISENSSHPDLTIDWYLPEVVIGERRFQMLENATELLPAMQKLEKLLGHNFGIGEDTLSLHVDKAIDNNFKECGFKTATIDTEEIDWHDLINRSVKREPPFERGEKEKGFRDSIIAQSFLHLHANSPSTPSRCRLALVTNDGKLADYVKELTLGSNNIRILSSLDELEGLINTLVSTVSEDSVKEFTRKANKLFFIKGDERSYYYKGDIQQKILNEFSKELSETIFTGHQRTDKTWYIHNPIFLKKINRRIFWSTTIEVEFEISHTEFEDVLPSGVVRSGYTNQEMVNALRNYEAGTALVPPPPPPLQTPPPPPPRAKTQNFSNALIGLDQSTGVFNLPRSRKVVDLTLRDKFEVYWNTNLSAAQNLTSVKLEKIQYLGNNMAEDHL